MASAPASSGRYARMTGAASTASWRDWRRGQEQHMGVVVKNRVSPKWVALVSGNMDQNLRSLEV